MLVTGASRRVGRAISLRLARRGCEVVLHCRRRNDEIDALRREIEAVSGAPRATVAELDLGDPSALEAFVRSHADGPWDGLVLNAASYARFDAPDDAASLASAALRDSQAHFRVNAAASLALSLGLSAALARSARAGGGAIVALGDMHSRGRPVRGFAPYLMSKAALGQMVDSLAIELAPRVRVNAVHPGVVAWPKDVPEQERRAYESRVPLGRSGAPDDAAGAVEWLLLDAPYLTGVHLIVDGGRSLR